MKLFHRHWSITLSCLLACCASQAQMLYQTDHALERRGLYTSTTYVQMTGDADYDTRLREALSDGWTLSRGIEFVEAGEPLGDPGDPRRSYISIWRLHESGSRSFLVLWQGGKVWDDAEGQDGGFSNADYWKSWVVAVPIDCIGRETQDTYIAWRLPLAVRSMVQLVDYAREKHPNVSRIGFQAGEMHGLRTASLQQKTLLLWKGRFTDEQLALFREHYPFRTEVVEMGVILQAMADRDPSYAVLVLSQAGSHQILSVHDAATYDLLYAQDEFEPYKGYELTPKAVKALARAVD